MSAPGRDELLAAGSFEAAWRNDARSTRTLRKSWAEVSIALRALGLGALAMRLISSSLIALMPGEIGAYRKESMRRSNLENLAMTRPVARLRPSPVNP